MKTDFYNYKLLYIQELEEKINYLNRRIETLDEEILDLKRCVDFLLMDDEGSVWQ